MTIWSVALLLVALLQVIRLFKPALLIFALPLAFLTAALSCLAVLLSLLGGTIGGSFHIDPEAQPVLWALAGVSFSGFLLLVAQVRLVLLRRRNSSTSS